MDSLVGKYKQSSNAQSVSVIRPEFQKGYTVPGLNYQKNGMLVRNLWPSKTHILRILPGYDVNTGEFYRQNIKCESYSEELPKSDYISNTFIKVPVIERFGDSGPVIAAYPADSEEASMWGGETVLRRMARRMIYACTDKKRKRGGLVPINEWRIWTGFGPSCRLDFDREALLFQALIFQINGRNNKDADGERDLVDSKGHILPLLALCILDRADSVSALCTALVKPLNRGLPLDVATNNEFGPLAEVNGNMLYLNPGKNENDKDVLCPSLQAPGTTGWKPTPFNLNPDMCKQWWQPWGKLLRVLTIQEQFELAEQEFGADTVNYVIGTDPTLQGIRIPDKIRAAGFGRYANLVGGSVTLNSGSMTMAPAASAAMPSGIEGMPAIGGIPVAAQVAPQSAGAPAFSMPDIPAGPATAQPKSGTGIQNTGTMDFDQVMAMTASIRAATGVASNTATQQEQQAVDAGDLLGSIPSEEDR